MSSVKVDFFSLTAQYKAMKDEIDSAVAGVMEKGRFILGEEVSKLEEEIASYCGVKYAVGVASGTDALLLSLRACGVGEGCGVITTPFTFVATVEVVLRLGAKVIFCDICPDTYNIDVDRIPEKATDDVKTILPVHLYGHSVEMGSLISTAEKYNLTIVEDAAQAFGGEYKGKKLGSFGKAGCLSFFPTKILGAFGDGGMVVTDDEGIRDRVRVLRTHGSDRKYNCEMCGYNSRLDELQAAVLRTKLKKVDEWIALRREIAGLYGELLEGSGVTVPFEEESAGHVYNYYCLRCRDRDALRDYLVSRGVQTSVYYPVPLHLQDVFKFLGFNKGDFPVAEKAAEEILAIPIFPELTKDDVHYVADAIKGFYR